MPRPAQEFQTIRSEGGLLPADLLRRVLDPRSKLEGTRPEDYGLPQNERLNDVITQSWARLRKHWREFRAAAAGLPEGEAGTGLTNDKWNLPLMRELGFGPLQTSAGREIGGRTYAISRFNGLVPVHLIGCGLSLDHRAAGQRGAAAINPHGLVQEFLNRSSGHLWAVLSNGLRLRILRDNQALSRQAFLEFDLEAIFTGEVYSDYVLLWLMAHATRFSQREEGRPETCWLEQWAKEAAEQGTRALGDLRGGVEKALQILGEGFTSHPKNSSLRDALRTGRLLPADFHGQLLRVVYRLIFLFVAEDRALEGQSLLHPIDESEAACIARGRFAAHYSSARLRDMAGRIKGSRHGDLWRQFQLLLRALSGDAASAPVRQQLALPSLGSFLWDPTSTQAINDAELTNHDFLESIRYLAFTRQGKVLRPVDYKNLGAEELGGVYESLLALTPQISADGARFNFAEFSGNERKTSGSYYTPDSLVQFLLDSALDPVVEEAIKGKVGHDAGKAILALKVCDPAVGSGHFLVGTAHRLARHLARVRALAQSESEPSPLLYQRALRDVIGRCLYGVDVNPMAAELCRVSLWLEALEPGKPLSFLDHHIRIGNSLLGATPELIAGGLPDEAFIAIEGDDKKACMELKKRNRDERGEIGPLFSQQNAETQARLLLAAAALEDLPDELPEDIQTKELALQRLELSEEYRQKKALADAWCAAFVFRKYLREPGRASSAIGIKQRNLTDLAAGVPLSSELASETGRLSVRYQFFHWHLAFPEVFAKGGFDCVLGNPPWERVKLQEKEWFAERNPDIANAHNASARKRMIESLKTSDAELYHQFLDDSRKSEGESHLMRNSARYPLCGRGDINLYAVFAEGMRNLANDRGRVGCVLPTGIATDDTTKFFFQDIVNKKSLVSLYDFENRKGLFPDIDSRMKFCLFTAGRGTQPTSESAEFVFFAHSVDDLQDSERRFTLSAEDIKALSPNTNTCPIFRSRRDAEITKAIYRRVAVLVRDARDGLPEENPWSLRIRRVFDMNKPEVLDLCTDQEPEGIDKAKWLAMFEAKLVHQFDHRFSSYIGTEPIDLEESQKSHAEITIRPRYWIPRAEVEAKIAPLWDYRWLFVWRDITNTTNERSAIAAALPFAGTDFTLRVGFPVYNPIATCGVMLANWNSYVLDYCVRQLMGGTHLSDYITKQLPVLSPNNYEGGCVWDERHQVLRDWFLSRVLELTYTAWDNASFAKDCGWNGPPFLWNNERRFLIRCELDAAFFHLYLPAEPRGEWKPASVAEGSVRDENPKELAELKRYFSTPREAIAFIMDTFPIVRYKDEENWGEFRTKRVILEIYDSMQESILTGKPYQTRLDPPSADPRCCHPLRKAS